MGVWGSKTEGNDMATEKLPTFKYHPDPLATGSVITSVNECVCCGKKRGYVYAGPAYAEEDYEECICPWCIADGSAANELGVTFHDEASIPGASFATAPEVDQAIIEEVTQRTPGFNAWQQEEWFTCCGDAGAFLGRAGKKELEKLGPDAIEAVRESSGIEDDEEWEEFFEGLDKDGSPTAYVFKCLHCGKIGAYQDCD
jgi:uncharacterized protein CbrC (UPF0167 family)